MIWLDLQKSYRDHTYLFLPKQPSVFSLSDHESMKVFEGRRLSHLSPSHVVKAIRHLVGIPLNLLRGSALGLGVLQD